MPYNFGSLGQTFGEKLAGVIRPSNTPEAKAKRAQDIKDARAAELEAYKREQDKIKNFADYGGYDPAQVMAGSAQVMAGSAQDALLSDSELASFQANMATPGNAVMRSEFKDESKFNPAADRAFRGFQEKQGSRGLTFEQRKELERIHAEETRTTKKTPSGGTVDKYAGLGGAADNEPLEDTTDYNGPFDWRHPFKTFGKGTKPAGKDTLKLF